jgi:type IV pilus assembly protein PilE
MKEIHMSTRQTGFTLLELMVTVAIIGILAAIAFPSYQEQARRGKRAEGKTALLKAAQLQERIYITGIPGVTNPAFYANNNQLPLLFGMTAGDVVYSGENPRLTTGAYVITVDANPNTDCTGASFQQCFRLRATPNGTHTDPKCQQLTLTSTGARNISGTGDTAARCWGM